MKNLKTFNELNESTGLKPDPMLKHVITKEEAIELFQMEEDDLAPGEPAASEEDFNGFVDKITGMTMEEYSKWRWPDEPQTQFDLAVKHIKK